MAIALVHHIKTAIACSRYEGERVNKWESEAAIKKPRIARLFYNVLRVYALTSAGLT